MFHSLLNVLHKEGLDALRDRRSISVSLTFAIFGPFFLYLMLDSMAKEAADDSDLRVAVVGAEQAPGLVNYLAEHNVEPISARDRDDAHAMLADDLPLMLQIPADYKRRYARRDTIELGIFGNFKEPKIEAQAASLKNKLDRFSQDINRSRLVAAGVSHLQVRTLSTRTYDLSRAGGRSAQITNALIYVFLIAGFVSGAFMTADSVAGERERHSLEPLLAQPVSPLALTLGKWLACGAVSVVVSTATIIVGGLLLNKAPLAELGLRLNLDAKGMLLGALTLAPLALFAVALQMMLAARAKTYREAGIYGQFTIFLPVAVAGALMLGKVEFGGAATSMPLTGHTLLLRDIFLDGGASLATIGIVSVTTLIAAAIMLTVTSRWLGDESRL